MAANGHGNVYTTHIHVYLHACTDKVSNNVRPGSGAPNGGYSSWHARVGGSFGFRIERLFCLDDARTSHAEEACDKNPTARALWSQRRGVGESEQVPGTCLQSTKPEALNFNSGPQSVAHRPYHSRQSCCEDPLPLLLASS